MISESIKGSANPVTGSPGRSSTSYSVLQCSRAFVVLAIAIACADNFADPDLWMHVLAGKRILHTGHIPLHDLYSYSAWGLPWYNHEWLAEVVLGASYQWLGVFGLKLVKPLCTGVTVVALSEGLSRTAAPPGVQRIVLLAVAAALLPYVQFRPQIFTFALLSVLIAKLATEVYNGPVKLWILIPMFALWANLHAGCLAGLAALVIFTMVIGAQELIAQRKLARASIFATVTFACALATLLNPLGTGQWKTFIVALTDPLIQATISDWTPLVRFVWNISHHSVWEPVLFIVPAVLLAGFAISLVAAPSLHDAALSAIALVFTAAAFHAVRNVPLAVISLSVPFAHHLGIALRSRAVRDQPDGPAAPSPVFILLATGLIALAGGEFSNRLETWEPVPKSAVAFMKVHGLHGNLLNDFDWGGYLIWHNAPQSKVFIDTRFELVYPDPLLREYLAFVYGRPGGKRLLDRYMHDLVLVKPGAGAHKTVASDPRWKLVYQDAVSVLFAKADAPIALETDPHPGGTAGPSWFP
jgi:hypothetical protein